MCLKDLIESRFGERCYLKILYHQDDFTSKEVEFKYGVFYDCDTSEPLDDDLIYYKIIIDYEMHLGPRFQYLEVWFDEDKEKEEAQDC